MRNKKTTVIIIYFVISVVLLFSANTLLELTTYSERKFVSIINLNPSAETMLVNDEEHQFELYDAQEIILRTADEITVTKTGDDQNIKTSVFNNLKIKPQLMALVVNNTKHYCYFKADLNQYINNEPEIDILNLVTEDNKIMLDLDLDRNIYLYPGKLVTDKVKSQMNTKKLIGVYPIECDFINDKDKITQTIQLYFNYNADQQRRYLDAKKQQVQNAKSFEELRNI